MREKVKCSKSNLESRKVEPRANDRLCRTLMRRQCISESLIPTPLLENVASQDPVAVDSHIGFFLYMNTEIACHWCVMLEMHSLGYRTGCPV